MFEQLIRLPEDPILGVIKKFQADPNPNKVDLGVGVYRDDAGQTPVMQAVKQAELALLHRQGSKSYVGPSGNALFSQAISHLLFGEQSPVLAEQRLTLLHTPGGCGALRVAAELIQSIQPGATLWVSDPTWGNHIPLLGSAGLTIKTYPYYNHQTHQVDFPRMLEALSLVQRGDIVLFHGCCHNPSGADLSDDQWRAIAVCAEQVGFTPFVDIAYQGFGVGLEEDAFGLRHLAQRLPEVLVAASCSKNFGVYRERVGAVGVVTTNASTAKAIATHLQSIVRGIYSMPPDHGAAVVAEVLTTPEYRTLWELELNAMRGRIHGLRQDFSAQMRKFTGGNRFDFVAQQQGMFSFLDISPGQVVALAERFGIHVLESSRANIAGLSADSINYVCEGLANVCLDDD